MQFTKAEELTSEPLTFIGAVIVILENTKASASFVTRSTFDKLTTVLSSLSDLNSKTMGLILYLLPKVASFRWDLQVCSIKLTLFVVSMPDEVAIISSLCGCTLCQTRTKWPYTKVINKSNRVITRWISSIYFNFDIFVTVDKFFSIALELVVLKAAFENPCNLMPITVHCYSFEQSRSVHGSIPKIALIELVRELAHIAI